MDAIPIPIEEQVFASFGTGKASVPLGISPMCRERRWLLVAAHLQRQRKPKREVWTFTKLGSGFGWQGECLTQVLESEPRPTTPFQQQNALLLLGLDKSNNYIGIRQNLRTLL